MTALGNELKKKTGFTVIEILLTVSIIAILTSVGMVNYTRNYRITALKNAAEEIATGFRLAQQKSMSQEQGVAWGVHLNNADGANPYFDVFFNAYAPENIIHHYRLPDTVGISNPVEGSGFTMSFAKLTGLPSTSTAITLINRGSGQTRTITINQFGGLDVSE